jgi:hypothetical protein
LTLVQCVTNAEARLSIARRNFVDVMTQIPSSLPLPDGARRIRNTSLALDVARQATTEAHNQLNDFLVRGIAPADLKLPGS